MANGDGAEGLIAWAGVHGLIGNGSQVDLGSVEFDQHCRVYAAPDRDDIWFHELFSPAFIAFLIERAPKAPGATGFEAGSAGSPAQG